MKYSLKELRARRNITQQDMANQLNIALGTYNRWENFPDKMQVKDVRAVCQILGVSMDEISLCSDCESTSTCCSQSNKPQM